MNPDVKAKWLEALRSGEYEQATGALKVMDDDVVDGDDIVSSFCCLGVLCDISGLGEWKGTSYWVGLWPAASALPKPVYEWAGLPDGNPCISPMECKDADSEGDIIETLADLNDSGASFEQIANVIEKEF
jgi:hypothetical protein